MINNCFEKRSFFRKLPLKIPECIPGIVGLVGPFSLWWRRYLSLSLYFWPTGSFVSSHWGCFPLFLKWPSPFLKITKWSILMSSTTNAVIKTPSAQRMDTPLTGAAFTHFVAFSKKAGTIVTRDLLPRRDGSNHFNTSVILLTRDELEGGGSKDKDKGWFPRGRQKTNQETGGECSSAFL